MVNNNYNKLFILLIVVCIVKVFIDRPNDKGLRVAVTPPIEKEYIFTASDILYSDSLFYIELRIDSPYMKQRPTIIEYRSSILDTSLYTIIPTNDYIVSKDNQFYLLLPKDIKVSSVHLHYKGYVQSKDYKCAFGSQDAINKSWDNKYNN